MNYNYLDFLAENETTYLRSRSVLLLFSIFALVTIVIMERNEYITEQNYPRKTIEVSEVEVSTMYKKPNATFTTKKLVEVEALKISSKDGSFYVNKNLKNKWDQIIRKIEAGDEILIHYQVVEGNSEIIHLESGAKIFFSLEDLINKFKYFKLISYLVFFLSSLVFIILFYKRRKLNPR